METDRNLVFEELEIPYGLVLYFIDYRGALYIFGDSFQYLLEILGYKEFGNPLIIVDENLNGYAYMFYRHRTADEVIAVKFTSYLFQYSTPPLVLAKVEEIITEDGENLVEQLKELIKYYPKKINLVSYILEDEIILATNIRVNTNLNRKLDFVQIGLHLFDLYDIPYGKAGRF